MLKSLRLRLLLIGFTTMLFLLVGAAPAAAVSSGNISHSYHATSSLANGSIVSLDPNRTGYLEMANTTNGAHLLGVTVPQSDSLIAVDPSSGTVQVATSGSANVLVSTFNGNIKIGDKIAVSPFNGVGIEASPGSYVIGVAQTAFSSNSPDATSRQVTDKNGQATQLQLGYVRLSIAIGNDSSSGGAQLQGLQKLVFNLTNRVVSLPRIIASLVIVLVAVIALITLIYASIFSSILAIGRNPLVKYTILRSLILVLIIAAIMAGLATAAIIFLLL